MHRTRRSRAGSAPRRARVRAGGVLWAVLALALPTAEARGAGPAGAEVRLSVQVTDARGKVPQDLTASDLEVSEAGTVMPVAALERWSAARAPARVALYVDRALSSSGTLQRSAAALRGLARQLAALGEVELVVAGVEPETRLRSRDELVLSETLARAALTETGERRILQLRQHVLREVRPASPAASATPEAVAETVTAAIEEELGLVRDRYRQLLAWAASGGAARRDLEAPQSPRLLLLVTDGFDLDPVGFYLRHLDDRATRAVIRGAARLETLEGPVDDTARALAALGWTVLPVQIAPAADDDKGLEYAPIAVGGERGEATSAPGIRLRPGSLFGRRGAEPDEPGVPEAGYLDARAPLELLAAASGGEVVTTDSALGDALTRFAGRFELRYVSALPLESSLEAIEVRAKRPGLSVRGRRWLARGIPQQVADVRVGRLLDGIEDDGGLDVAAVLQLDRQPESDGAEAGARLEARLALRDLEAASPGEAWTSGDGALFRVTLAVAAAGPPRISYEVVRADDLEGLEEWRYRAALELPAGATEVAVLVEELATGAWGGRRATLVESGVGTAGELLPAPTVVEIQAPDEELLRGRVKFDTEVYDPRVARVDFLLDDRVAASSGRRPFSARLDLGRTPRRRTLAAVAYDAGGAELGRDAVVLNGGSGGLAVQIVRPQSLRGTGWVEVEAEVEVPLERRLDRVLYFWNNRQVATVYAPPFRQRVFIPEDKPVGYVRVVALLDDGTLAEDVAFMNGPVHGERLEVNLVELYVVVTDAAGRPVRGLERDEFRVREDGVPQEIAAFSDASDLPLTLGLAIDSSASMFVKLPRVQGAAIDFLRSTFSEQDRAFVVDFDSEPRLARSTTGSLDRVVDSIGALEASGRTALWESIVFSLVQLQGVRGRKALVVFSDGADEDDRFPFRSSLTAAKKMGVPIYLILMRKEPRREAGLSLLTRSFTSRVNRLVEATGGRVFYAREYRDLGEVYAEIEHELRSQYLLAYYPREPSRGESWRTVDVDVARRGLKPRTLSGYWD